MGLPEALIFDVDGTLADTEKNGHRVAFNAAFAAAGLDWDWTLALYGELLSVTGGKERIRFYLDRYNTAFERPVAFDDFVASLHAAKTEHYTRMLKDGGIPLRPGIKRLIDEARAAGVRLAIATTTTPVNVTALLSSTLGECSQEWFEVIAAGDVVPAKKPASDIFDYALEALKLPAQCCVAFEDSANGVRSSYGAKIPTLVTLNDYTKDDDVSGACLVLNHLGEPDEPFTVIEGDAFGKHCVDLELLRRLLQACG